MVMALSLAACSSSSESYSYSFNIMNGKEGEAVIDNADKDTAVSSGALEVGEGEEILITSELENGKVLIQIQKSAETGTEDTDTLNMEPPTFDHADVEVEMEGSEIAHCTVAPGEYDVNIVMQDKTSGKISMTVQPAEAAGEAAGEVNETAEASDETAGAADEAAETSDEAAGEVNETAESSDETAGEADEAAETADDKWTAAATAEEAAQGAGLDSMADLKGTVISLGELGTMGDVTYKYMDGAVQVSCPAAAVEMFVIKAKDSTASGDVSFDSTAYANEWTQDVDGQQVTCFGNREGEATKTIWTAGDYSYAVLAYGAGGDDDYGLSAEDVAIMVNAVK